MSRMAWSRALLGFFSFFICTNIAIIAITAMTTMTATIIPPRAPFERPIGTIIKYKISIIFLKTVDFIN